MFFSFIYIRNMKKNDILMPKKKLKR